MKKYVYIASLLLLVLVMMPACRQRDLAHVAVTTNPVTNITTRGATLNGHVSGFGDATIAQVGFCYSESELPTLEDGYILSIMGLGRFTVKLSNLEENTRYYVRAFSQNTYSVQYGDVVEFRTAKQLIPLVETIAPRGITTNGSICGGNVTRSGEAEVFERGICYSSSSTAPTTSGTHVVAAVAGTGKYECVLGALTSGTTYYVRAYAINQYGTAYGDVLQFTTK